MVVNLKADERKDLRRSTTRLIRNKGAVPAVVYGNDKQPVTVSVDSLELVKTLRDAGKNAIITLNIEGQAPVQVMLHEFQSDPLKDEMVHADFYIVNMAEEVDVTVPIHLDGEAQGVKDGGVLQQPLHELSIRSKPNDIPEEIKLDVKDMTVGDSITVSDLKGSSAYEIMEDENTTIVSILPPQTEEVTESGEQQEEQPEEETESEDEEA